MEITIHTSDGPHIDRVCSHSLSLSHLASLPRVLFMQLKRCPFNTFMLGFTVKEDYTFTKIITLIFLNLFSLLLKSTSEYIRLNFLQQSH